MSRLSGIGLGCSRVGSFNNQTPMEEVRATLRSALDLGVTVFDTSNVYGQGDSEREIGKALASRRDEAFVVTKLGKVFSAKMRLMALAKPIVKAILPRKTAAASITGRREAEIGQNFDPAIMAATLEASLRRLKMDHVDALLLHSPPAAVAANPAVGEALAAIKRAGKVGEFGVSCDDMACLEAALAMPGITLLELPMDVIAEASARGMTTAWQARGVRVLAREVLRLRPEGQSPAEAIAAACADPASDCVIVGASRLAHLQQAVDACHTARKAKA